VEAAASNHRRIVVDACCPLVTKVHHEMKVRARKGYTVLYVGHEGHEEAIGTMAVAPGAARLVETAEDIEAAAAAVPAGTPVALLAQTTLPHGEWSGLVDLARRRFPDMWMPGRSDLCYATTNRQAAMRALAPGCDTVVVVGSENSSNTLALAKVASQGCPQVIRVNSPDELPEDLSGVVGVTAGASAPEWLVSEILDRLAPAGGVEIVHVTDEDEYFPPPPELRDLLRSTAAALDMMLGAGSLETSPMASDRSVRAADVLQPTV
ncbi:MAG: 4-hydroxy-3-methylbut-2-enyl diphosphate reductase, partial [Acidimicrobiales bacterium]